MPFKALRTACGFEKGLMGYLLGMKHARMKLMIWNPANSRSEILWGSTKGQLGGKEEEFQCLSFSDGRKVDNEIRSAES